MEAWTDRRIDRWTYHLIEIRGYGGTMMRPHPVVELTDEHIFWAGLKHFHWDFWSGFTVVFCEKYAFLSLSTKRLRTNGPTDQWTDTASYRNARTHLKMTEDAMLCCLPALMMTMIGTLKSESAIKLVSTRKGHNYLAFLNTGGEIYFSSIAQRKL